MSLIGETVHGSFPLPEDVFSYFDMSNFIVKPFTEYSEKIIQKTKFID